ncbi:MAG: hypothetical protein AAGE52_33550 [Myxococcota bacterium]
MRTALCLGLLAACAGSTPPPAVTTSAPPPPTKAPPPPSHVPPVTEPPPAIDAPAAIVFQGAHRRGIEAAAFTPDGSLLGTIDGGGTFALIDVETGVIRHSRRVFIRDGARFLFAERGNTGMWIASSSGFRGLGGLWRIDLRSGEWTQSELPTATFPPSGFAMHPDDRTAGYLDTQAMVRDVVVLAEEASNHEVSLRSPGYLSFAPRGNRIVVFDFGEREAVLLTLDGREVVRWPSLVEPAWHPRGGALAIASPESAGLYDPETGRPLRTLSTNARELLWSASGAELVSIGENELSFFNEQGAPQGSASRPEGASNFVFGNGVLYAGVETAVHSWRDREPAAPVDVGGPIRQLIPHPQDGVALLFGTDVAFVRDGAVRWRVRGGSGEHSVWQARWAPTGTTLITWGRGGVERWDAQGATSTGCRGGGRFLWPTSDGILLQQGDACSLRDGERTRVRGSLLAASGDHRVLLFHDGVELWIVDAETLERRRRLRLRGGPCGYGTCEVHAALTHDGQTAVLSRGSDLFVFDTQRGRLVRRVRGTRRDGPVVDVHAPTTSGAAPVWAAVRRGEGEELKVSVHEARGRRVLELTRTGIARITFNDDGTRVAISGNEGIFLGSLDGSQRVDLQPLADVDRMRFVGDELIVQSLRELRVADASGVIRTAHEHSSAFSLSPDAASAAECYEGRLLLRELLTTRVRDLGPCGADQLAFNPSGRFLVERDGPVTQVHDLQQGRAVTLRTFRDRHDSFPVVIDSEGAFDVDPAAHERFRYRSAGPLGRAELLAPAAAPYRPDILERFFPPPAPTVSQ